jgi:Spy/CpxP family protein refolding chaperone
LTGHSPIGKITLPQKQKTMKTLPVRIIVALLLLNLGLSAQDMHMADTTRKKQHAAASQAQREKGGKQAEALKEIMGQLNLSEEQKKQLREQREVQGAALKKLKADSTLSPESRKARMKALREENSEKMKQILTAEQYNKMQELIRQRKEEGRKDD